jgi:Immunity protein Imm1
MAELASPDGGRMAVGLGETESVATFSAPYEEPPYFVSRGSGGGDGAVVFFYDGHWTEFDPEAVIALAEALDAVREFFATGTRPTLITWAAV